MDHLLSLFGDLGSVIKGTVLVVAVILGLTVLSRILQRNSAAVTGRRFRNQLIMSGAVFLGLLIIILALPIDPTMRGQLLSLVGIIISAGIALSSSTILGNAMAGIMLKTLRNFHSGDFVQIEDFFGRVTERGLFHTEIQTPDRDLVTLPNMFLATSPVKVVRASGTVVSATVSLGYDVPHTKIEDLLQEAAAEVKLQEPFVQILDLGDFSVTYRVAGLLEEPKRLLVYRSRLRTAMLDRLHGAGVEIVSPKFLNVRDFDTKREFIPSPVLAKKDQTKDAAPLEVVFDKAEFAASVTALTKEQAGLEEELKEAKQAQKDARDDGEKQKSADQVARIEARLSKIDEDLALAQEKELDD